MRNMAKANESRMSRRGVEKLSLGWICSFCENNVVQSMIIVAERAGLTKWFRERFMHFPWNSLPYCTVPYRTVRTLPYYRRTILKRAPLKE
jgi:hypothetical protein